ncbi:hypothetical protein Tco_1048432 [Tanacetum coccineum]
MIVKGASIQPLRQSSAYGDRLKEATTAVSTYAKGIKACKVSGLGRRPTNPIGRPETLLGPVNSGIRAKGIKTTQQFMINHQSRKPAMDEKRQRKEDQKERKRKKQRLLFLARYMPKERWGQGYDLRGFTLIEEDNRRMGTYLNRNQNNNRKAMKKINKEQNWKTSSFRENPEILEESLNHGIKDKETEKRRFWHHDIREELLDRLMS